MLLGKGTQDPIKCVKGIEVAFDDLPVQPSVLTELSVVSLCMLKEADGLLLYLANFRSKVSAVYQIKDLWPPVFDVLVDRVVTLNAEHLRHIENGALNMPFHSAQMVAAVGRDIATCSRHMPHEMVEGISVLVPHLDGQFGVPRLIYRDQIASEVVKEDRLLQGFRHSRRRPICGLT